MVTPISPSRWVLFVNPVFSFSSRTALCALSYSLVYSYLKYCILVWGSTYPTHFRRVVLLQKRIVGIISHKDFDIYTDPLFKNLMVL